MVRRILFGLVVLGVALAAGWALWPRPLPAETATIERRAIEVSIEDEGLSRIRDIFTVSAPITGKLLRLGLEPGDPVSEGQTVASIQPTQPALLDARARAVAEANVSAAQSAVDEALAQQQQAEAQLDFAQKALKRAEALAGQGIVPEQIYQKALLDLSLAQTGLNAARASLVVRQRQLESASAALIEGQGTAEACDCVEVKSPASGEVLTVMTKSEQVALAGTPLLQLGDPANLEIAVDLLSRDAVAVSPGDPASVESWGGPPLGAVVDRIAPAAVTKVSALGIEEQRVTVLLRLTGSDADRRRLGHGFRVVARIRIWRGENLVAVPMAALFRQGEQWAVFVARDGVAHLRTLTIGHQNADYAEVTAGLEPGEQVILHPGDRIADGVAIAPGGRA